jgi:hypothetical protein
MKSYDISVDSDVNAAGTITDRVYYFDFSKLPRCRYSIDWTFQSAIIPTLSTLMADGPICIHMDSYTGPYQFQAAASTCPTHSVFGALVPNMISVAAGGFMGADMKQNGSILLDTLPPSGFFTIKIRYGMGTTAPTTFARYFMSMELTPLDDYE